MPRVAIIDYGMCNLGSVRRAFEECGAEAVVTEDPGDLFNASHVVLPGVGAYRDGMANIRERKWDAAIHRAVVDDRIPLLGICLGMQLVSSVGYEGGETEGLGLVPGAVKKLVAPAGERIPHIGWNEVHHQADEPLFRGIPSGTDFYFVHSYHFLPLDQAHIAAKTPYCGGFTAAVRAGNVFGVQFHPEKSSLAGFQLIRNFLGYRS